MGVPKGFPSHYLTKDSFNLLEIYLIRSDKDVDNTASQQEDWLSSL